MKNALINADVQQLLAPQVLTDTITTALFDAKGINGSADFLVNLGALTADDSANYFTLTITHSDTTANGDFGAVAAGDVLLNELPAINDSAGQANKCYRISVNPRKRYTRITLTETGTASAAISITGVGGALRSAPQPATAVGASAT